MGRNYLYTSQGVIMPLRRTIAVLGDAGGTGGARLNGQRASSIRAGSTLFGAIEGIASDPRPGQNPAVLVVYTHLRHQSLAGTAVVGQHSAGLRLSLFQGTSRMYRIRRHAPTVLGKATGYAAPKSAPLQLSPQPWPRPAARLSRLWLPVASHRTVRAAKQVQTMAAFPGFPRGRQWALGRQLIRSSQAPPDPGPTGWLITTSRQRHMELSQQISRS